MSYNAPMRNEKAKVPVTGARKTVRDRMAALGMNKAELSSIIKKNSTYIQQWIEYGKPTHLPDRVRRDIASALNLNEKDLIDYVDLSYLSGQFEDVIEKAFYRPPPPLFFEGTIPVYASAEGGDGHIIVSTDEIGRAPRPDVLGGAEHAYAILITGDSMIKAYEPGDRALVNPHLGPAAGSDCILYSIEDGEAKATIKRMVSWTDREWTLEQFSPEKTFKRDRGIWTVHHRVVGNLKRQFGGRVPFSAP